LVHLVGFITKKFVTMHGHMNAKEFLFLEGEILRRRTGHSEAHNNFCELQNLYGFSCASCILKLQNSRNFGCVIRLYRSAVLV
jgi:hypothetical protein